MKKIALLLTGSLCSFGMSFSTYGSTPLTANQAEIYLDLLETNYDYTYVTSHLHDLTGDKVPELLISYQTEASKKQEFQTDIWQILEGELSPVVFDGTTTDALSIVTDEKGNSYLYSESNQDLALSGGILYHIYSYKEGGISPIYELSRVETFLWDEDTHSYDTSSPLDTFIENGIPVKDTISSTDLYEELEKKYQLDQQIHIYPLGEEFSKEDASQLTSNAPSSELEPEDTSSHLDTLEDTTVSTPIETLTAKELLEEIIREGKYARFDPMNYQQLLAQLPYPDDFTLVPLQKAQAQAFLEILQEETGGFEAWKESFSQKIGFFHSSTEEIDTVNPDIFVAFFPVGDNCIGMLANNTIYTWTPLIGLQQVTLPTDWNVRIFETENQEIYVEYYRSSQEDSYFYAGLHRSFRNGSLVDTGYKSFQWSSEEESTVADIILEETGVNLSDKLLEVAGKTETSLGEPLYQLHFYQDQIIDTLPFNIEDKTTLITSFSEDFPCFQGNFSPYKEVEALLERIITKAEHFTGFPLLMDWETLLQPITNDLSQDFTGDMIENVAGIYDLSENLFYLVVQEADASLGAIVGKGVIDGYESYYLMDSLKPLMLEEDLQSFVYNHLNQTNISIDYEKMSECVTPEDFLLLLEESLNLIQGTSVNERARSEIAHYIELSLAQIGRVSVGASDNFYEVNSEIFINSREIQQNLKSDFEKLLFKHQIILEKELELYTEIVVQNIDGTQATHLHLDSNLLESLGGNGVTLFIAGTSNSVSIRGAHLPALLTEHGFSIRLIPGMAGSVTLQFEDGLGKVTPTLTAPVSITLYCGSYFSTVFHNTEDRLIPWGGQYDTTKKTITFSTFSSGKFEILDNSVELSDISYLEDTTQEAIIFLVSKGLFDAEKGKFHPEDSLTRYELAKLLSTLYSVTDDTRSTSYKDVDADDHYAPYIASVQKYDLLSGYTDTEFGGELPVTVESVLVLIARTLWEVTGAPLPEFPQDFQFAGLSDANSWSQVFLALAHREGIILHGEEIVPDAELTREDAAVYFYRLFQILYPIKPVHFEMPVEHIDIVEPEQEVLPIVPQGGVSPVHQEEFDFNEKEFAMAAGTGLGLIMLLGFFRILNRTKGKSKKKTSIILSMDELPDHIIDLEEVVAETEKTSVPTYQEKEVPLADQAQETPDMFTEDYSSEETEDGIDPDPEPTVDPEPVNSFSPQTEPFVPPVVYPTEEMDSGYAEALYKLEEQRPHIKPQLLIQSTEPS